MYIPLLFYNSNDVVTSLAKSKFLLTSFCKKRVVASGNPWFLGFGFIGLQVFKRHGVISGDREKTLRKTRKAWGSDLSLSFQVTDSQVQWSYPKDEEITLQRKQGNKKTLDFLV